METCDVIVAGGGPAGSACAWALRQADLDVVVVDRATFPRDKVCAGWITPQVVSDLRLDVSEYRLTRTFQPFTRFHVGIVGGNGGLDTVYDRPVSYGIRRCEFDEYLLRRSTARLQLGAPVSRIRRDAHLWTVDDRLSAPMLVGAGGHFCEVGRMLNGPSGRAGVVVAQEAEFAIAPGERASFTSEPDCPELYFAPSLDGYGWCVRKQDYLNIGFGHLDHGSLPDALAKFVAFLASAGKVPATLSCRWKGHAYALLGARPRVIVDAGVVLVGDAAALASPHSGEGIRPAIESGLMAASTIVEARGSYTRDRLAPYEQRLRNRFDAGGALSSAVSRRLPPPLKEGLGAWLLRTPWFVRHVLLDRWFLHAQEPPLAPA